MRVGLGLLDLRDNAGADETQIFNFNSLPEKQNDEGIQ